MRDRIKPVYYQKLLRSMLLLFLLPALTTVVLASAFQSTSMRKHAVDLQSELMDKLASVADQQLNQGLQMAFHCAYDSFFLEVSRKEYDLLTFKETTHRLVALCATNTYLNDIIILYKDKPMNYASSGIYPNYASPAALYIDGQLPEAYCTDRENQFVYKRATLSRAGILDDVILYVLPSPMRPELIVTVVMKPHILLDVLKSDMHWQEQDGFDLLFNGNGECVLASRALDGQTLETVYQWAASEGGDNTLTLDGVRYLAIHKHSASSGVTYIHCESKSGIVWSGYLPIALFAFFSLLTFGTAYIIVRRIADRNYQPVKTLFASISDADSIPEGMDEFSAITLAFHNLKALIGTYDATFQNQIPANRMRLLSNLFSGHYDAVEDFNFAAAYAGVKFTMPHFWVALVSIDEKQFEEDAAARIEAMLPPSLEGFGARTHNPHEYVFVLAGIETMPIHSMLEDVLHRCALSMRVTITITLSQCRTSLSNIGQAFIECHSLHTHVSGNGKLNVYVSDPKDTVNLLRVSGELQELFLVLREAILDGRVDDVMHELDTFSKSLERMQFSYFEKQCVCYDLANCVIHALSDMLSNDEFAHLEFPGLTELTSFKNESELVQTIGELSQMVSNELRRSSYDRKPQKPSIDDIIAYIHAHCADYEFSVKQLADRHGMSLSTFSQYFKAQCGLTAIVYILKCRIDRAKYLLENTDMTIADIVFAIGYISVPTFTNKFKQVCGITPGEFRERMRKSKGDEDGERQNGQTYDKEGGGNSAI